MYSVVPFLFSFIANCFLIHETVRSKSQLVQRTQVDISKRRATSITVIAVIICFILLTLPHAVVTGYLAKYLDKNPNYAAIIVVTSAVSLTYHSFTFIILLVSNKQFLKEVKYLIAFKKNTKISTIEMVITRPKGQKNNDTTV